MRLPLALLPIALLVFAVACHQKTAPTLPDHPRLTPNVRFQDVIFHSVSLDRDMPYRVILPVSVPSNKRLPALYLLHGGGGGWRDWSNYSDVARFAEAGLILVMPEGNSSYYVNAAERPQDRYEDYITKDLITDVERRFPTAPGRANRAIAGISMGGFGAVTLALKHPDLYAFAAGLVPRWMFRAGHSRSRELASIAGMLRSLDLGEVKLDTRMIPICLRRPLIRRTRHTFISVAEIRKACFRQTRNSLPFLRSTASSMSLTPAQVATIGINGTGDCRTF